MKPSRRISLLIPDSLPKEESAEQPGRDQPGLVEMRAFAESLLARREYAVLEMHARLLRKWPASTQIEQAVTELVSSLQIDGVLSDERFTESFIRSRCQRYQGPFKIHADLRKRQVPEQIIELSLQSMDDNWCELALSWLSKQTIGSMDFATRAKFYRRLCNRGFTHQQAMGALNNLKVRFDTQDQNEHLK